MWLCAPRPGQDDPPTPRWASRLIEEFSEPGDRVVIRGLSGYPGMAGEITALIAAARHSGRHPMALLPTRAAAAATRTLIHASTTSTTTSSATSGDNDAPTDPTANPIGDPLNEPPGRAALPLTPRSPGLAVARPEIVPVARDSVARVSLPRRRGESAPASVGLQVVVAGPVAPGARGVRRALSPRLIAAWARVLRPGGLLAVLAPPPIGRGASRTRVAGAGELVRAAQDAALAYTQHIVLTHTPTQPDGTLAAPRATRRPHAPFRPVHTDLWIFTHYPSHAAGPFDPLTPTGSLGGPRVRGEEQESA